MKKIFFCILFIVLFIPNFVLGNDYAFDTSLWLKHDKTICWSMSNLEEYEGKVLFVFDYSRETGRSFGKPWTIIESGKCYQVNSQEKFEDELDTVKDDREAIYVLKLPLSPEFQSIINNTTNVESSLDDFIQPCEWKNGKCEGDSAVFKIFPSINVNYTLGASLNDIQTSYDLYFSNLLPTKFILTGWYDGGLSSPPTEQEEALLNDSRSLQAQDLRRSLLNDLQSMLNKCDTRQRIEEKGVIEFNPNEKEGGRYSETSDTVWRLESGEDFWVDYNMPALERIQLMGCSDEYHSFLKEKKDSFTEFDQLVETLYNKYGTYNIEERKTGELKILTDFAKATTTPLLEITAKPVSYKSPSLDSSADNSSLDSISPVDNPSDDTPAPNSATKTETENHQENSSGKTYWLYFAILPILGGIGLIWWIKQKNKKTFLDNTNL